MEDDRFITNILLALGIVAYGLYLIKIFISKGRLSRNQVSVRLILLAFYCATPAVLIEIGAIRETIATNSFIVAYFALLIVGAGTLNCKMAGRKN